MTQWEYTRASNPTWQELNDLGDEGWELVSVDSYGLAIFKRPKHDAI